MAFAITSFSRTVQDVRCVPAGWYDSGKVRAQVFHPDATTFGRGPWQTGCLYVDYGGFTTSAKVTTIDDGGDTPGLLPGLLNNGHPVVTLEVSEGGDKPYLKGRGGGLLHPVDDANGYFLNPDRPMAPKDIWGALTWLKKYGRVACGVDFSKGCILYGNSSGGIAASWIALADNRGAGRYPALETDPCLSEFDSRPTVFVHRQPSVRFRSLVNTITGAGFPTTATSETACATLADVATAYLDAYSSLLTTATYEARDREAAARMWTYMWADIAQGSSTYTKTASGDWVNNVTTLHDVWPQRVWRGHTGRCRTRAVIGATPTLNALVDDAQIADPMPFDGSNTDMLDFALAHLEG